MSVTLRRGRRYVPDQVSNLAELTKSARKTAERLGPYAETARENAAERLIEARKWAAPRLEDAAQAFQETVAPRVSSALAVTAQRVEPVEKEAKKRGRAVLKALQGQQKQRRRWPIAVAFFVLGGVVGAAIATARNSATPLPPSGLDEPADSATPAEAEASVNGRFAAS